MDQTEILDYAVKTLVIILELSMLPIVVATVIGILVSLIQALTQIQEQTLSFAIKLIAISGTLLLAAQWMGGEMIRFTQNILERFPGITK